MPKGLNFPLYVPASCAEVEGLISTNRIREAIVSLEQKTSLGDAGAAAVLGYLQLRNALPNPKVDLIGDSLRRAAESGDPYAEFVLALALRALGQAPAAAQWMGRSANHVFPPAQAHLGRYMIHGIGFKESCRASAWQMYKLSLRQGHVPTALFVTDFLRTSSLRFVRAVGLVLYPIARLAFVIQFLARPFGVRTFIHISDADRPLFTSPADV